MSIFIILQTIIALVFIYLILALLASELQEAIAIAMGAPFWFEMLGKIINVRNAGKPADSPK